VFYPFQVVESLNKVVISVFEWHFLIIENWELPGESSLEFSPPVPTKMLRKHQTETDAPSRLWLSRHSDVFELSFRRQKFPKTTKIVFYPFQVVETLNKIVISAFEWHFVIIDRSISFWCVADNPVARFAYENLHNKVSQLFYSPLTHFVSKIHGSHYCDLYYSRAASTEIRNLRAKKIVSLVITKIIFGATSPNYCRDKQHTRGTFRCKALSIFF
jgi:hypothetical protein